LLVGSYTDGASQGIYRYGFDERNGHIDAKPQQVVKASALHGWCCRPTSACCSRSMRPRRAMPAVSLSTKGEIKPLNQVASQGDEPTHASLSHDQRYLFVANYAVAPTPAAAWW
jgi:6-phosphogluconolactonase (cycloisomerase 2 family)